MNKFDMSLFLEKDAPWISWKLSTASLDMSFVVSLLMLRRICVHVLWFLSCKMRVIIISYMSLVLSILNLSHELNSICILYELLTYVNVL